MVAKALIRLSLPRCVIAAGDFDSWVRWYAHPSDELGRDPGRVDQAVAQAEQRQTQELEDVLLNIEKQNHQLYKRTVFV